MLRQPEPLTSLGDLVNLVFRHRSKVVLWFCLVMTVSVGAVIALPRKYESDAKLFIRLGRETVSLDPTATTGTTIAVQESRENQLNSTREMLKSRALLGRVVDIVGAAKILNTPSDAKSASGSQFAMSSLGSLSWLKISPSVSPAERAIEKLSQSIDVNVARNSSVIDVGCTASSPKLAREMLEAYLSAFQEQHLKANRTSGSLEFFSTQTAQAKKQLDSAAARLRDVKNESGLVSITAEQKALQDQLLQIEAASFAADASLASSEASISSLKKSLAELPEQIATQKTSGFPNTAADNMWQEFFRLQVAARALEAKLGAEHPLVKVQLKQVEQLEEVLGEQPHGREQTTIGMNSARQALDVDLRREQALVAALRAKGAALKEQYALLHDRLRTLNDFEVTIQDLTREEMIAETNYKSYANHLEQARIVEALGTNGISSVNVVQPPSLVEKPVSPKPSLVLGLGFMAAMCGCIGLPFGSEYLGQAIRAARETRARQQAAESPVPTPHSIQSSSTKC